MDAALGGSRFDELARRDVIDGEAGPKVFEVELATGSADAPVHGEPPALGERPAKLRVVAKTHPDLDFWVAGTAPPHRHAPATKTDDDVYARFRNIFVRRLR